MALTTNSKKFGKLLGGYGLGIFLNQSVNLFMIPILWHTLKPEDFGIIATTQIITLFLAPIFMFGISDTIQRFYYQWEPEARPHYLGWTLWFVLGFTFLFTLLLDFFGNNLFSILISQVPYDPLIRFTIWSVFLSNVINVPIAISRIKQKVINYNILVNGSFLTQIAIIYYMVKVENLGAYGYVKGTLIANLIWFLPTLFVAFRDCAFFPDKRYKNIPLNYAGPLCIAGALEGGCNMMDRYFLDKYIPLATMGFYNLARQISSPINIANILAKLIIFPFFYKHHAEKKNTADLLTRLGLIYTVAMTIPVVAITALAREVVQVLDPSGVYLSLVEFVPYFAVAFYINSLATIHGRGMDLKGSSKWSIFIPLTSLLICLGIYIWALPRYGVYGALIGFVANFVVRTIINNAQAYYFLPRHYHFNKILLSWGNAALFFFFLHYIRIENIGVSIAVDLLVIFIFAALQLGLVIGPEMKSLLLSEAKEMT